MNASRAVSENWVRLAAMNASASEQIAITTASAAERKDGQQPVPGDRVEHVARHDRLQRRRRRRADDQEAARMEEVVLGGCREHGQPATRRACASAGRARASSSRPKRDHTSPTTIAASRLATRRAPTISGFPGNATAVATSTTGLIAGAESRNVSAAAAGAPRDTSRPAIGTEPHSQPGKAAPATAATGTESAGRSGARAAGSPPGRRRRSRR